MPLDQLGPYKLDRVLGRGGMGAVYAGLNQQTGEWAAVKVLSAVLADDPAFRERFKIEIETLKKLRHPNIVQLHGYGEEAGHLFYVMELIEGRSLQDDLVKRRRFSWQEATRIGIAVARALKHAHDRGIVHRDLKPANLLVDQEENIKLTDFGIAKLFGVSNLTMEGGVIGTADYMAPEQADGKGATIRSDLYSLGNVLYALMAGKPPFSAKSVTEVLHGLKNEKPIALHRICHEMPGELDSIVMQLLEKDPQKRIPTALAVANRLQAMEHALTQAKPNPQEGVIQFPPEENVGRRGAVTQADANAQATAVYSHPADKGQPTVVGATSPSLPQKNAPSVTAAEAVTAVHLSVASQSEGDASGAAPKATHFTTVSEAELRNAATLAASEEDSWTRWVTIGLMIAGIVLVTALVWGALQPLSAEKLFARIEAAAAGGDVQSLLSVEADIEQFLSRFGDDPRAVTLKAYQEDIELHRLQRQFEFKARNVGLGEGLLPVERAYLEAMRIAASDPELALRRFTALEQVFAGSTAHEKDPQKMLAIARCVELARKQKARLKRTVEQSVEEQQQFLKHRLQEVNEFAVENPQRAEKILAGIIELYDARPWAAELIAEARQLQQRLSAAGDSQP